MYKVVESHCRGTARITVPYGVQQTSTPHLTYPILDITTYITYL